MRWASKLSVCTSPSLSGRTCRANCPAIFYAQDVLSIEKEMLDSRRICKRDYVSVKCKIPTTGSIHLQYEIIEIKEEMQQTQLAFDMFLSCNKPMKTSQKLLLKPGLCLASTLEQLWDLLKQGVVESKGNPQRGPQVLGNMFLLLPNRGVLGYPLFDPQPKRTMFPHPTVLVQFFRKKLGGWFSSPTAKNTKHVNITACLRCLSRTCLSLDRKKECQCKKPGCFLYV